MGFTLFEVVLATTILAVGAVSVLMLTGACSQANGAAEELTQAVFFAQEVREWTVSLPFSDPDEAQAGMIGSEEGNPAVFVDDLDDLAGAVLESPRNAKGETIADTAGWSEKITVVWLDPKTHLPLAGGASDVARVEVQMNRNGRDVYSTGWVIVNKQGA